MQKFNIAEKKHSDEIKNWGCDFTNVIAVGDSLASYDVKIYEDDGTDVTSTMLVGGSIAESDNIVTAMIQEGTSGSRYYADYIGTMTSGAVEIGRLIFLVLDV